MKFYTEDINENNSEIEYASFGEACADATERTRETQSLIKLSVNNFNLTIFEPGKNVFISLNEAIENLNNYLGLD